MLTVLATNLPGQRVIYQWELKPVYLSKTWKLFYLCDFKKNQAKSIKNTSTNNQKIKQDEQSEERETSKV
jgi:hypothetical protein